MGNKQSSVKVTVYIDQEKQKVMFAEVQENFVEILFSIMTLPLGRIISLCNHTYSKDTKVGSLTSLYQSVVKLDSKLFWEGWKYRLLYPINSSASICRKLKVDLDHYDGNRNGNGDPVFLQNKGSFLITDDLKITPFSLDKSVLLLNSLGVEHVDLLEKRTMSFGYMEFSKLLKWSLLTSNPMTNVVIEESKPVYSCLRNSTHFLSSVTSVKTPQMIKLLVQKSKKKVIHAIVGNAFANLLFSFLTIPLGRVKRLRRDTLSPLAINNVCNSISCLRNGNFLKSDDVKFMLLYPQLSPTYFRATDFLPIYQEDKRRASFLKKHVSFIISDDLKIEVAQSSISDITKVTLGIPAGDIEVLDVSIGEQEALFILTSSLTSTTVLTDLLNTFKKPMV